MRKGLSFLGIIAYAVIAQAGYLETIQVHSDAMNKEIPVSVIFPDDYKTGDTRYPVIYVMHGAGGSHQSFTQPGHPIYNLVDRYKVIAVCPDGARTSWWLDSPVDPAMKYETFAAKELVAYFDKTYRTLAQREKRGITGGSMGGHGACYLALRNKQVFGVVGNIYGGVDLRPFPNNWDLSKRLGTIQEHPENWEQHSVITLAKELKNGELSLVTMIGNKDFFLGVNRALHQLLSDHGVEHYYIEAQGAHTREFSAEAFPVMFRFINTYFTEGRGHL